MRAPLAGLTVTELGDGAAIAYAGKLFADLGAQVTRIGAERSGEIPENLAQYLNIRKQRVGLNGVAAAARAELRAILQGSRILLHAPVQQPNALECDASTLAAEFPQLVVVSVTPFGIARANDATAADDLTLQAMGGICIGIGLPNLPPLKLPGDQSAFQAGLAAAISGLGLLFSRRGALVDVAGADVWASFYSGVEVALAHFGRGGKRRAGHRVSGQPYPRTLFRCKDGYFAIQCGESRHWQSFLSMIGREDLLTHELFANRFDANDRHGDACDALIEPWFSERTKDEILSQCLAHKIPGAPVYDIGEVVTHPHLRGRNFFAAVDVHGKTVRLPSAPYPGLAHAGSCVCTPDDTRSRSGKVAGKPEAATNKLRPLAHLRVIDFGWVWAGAVPGHILADMGAEVIKVESASPLDYMRQGRPVVGTRKDPEQNPMFQNVNRGKLSLRIKLDHPQAAAVIKDLVAASDVVIENFAPGVMSKFGLAYEDLQPVRPDLVMCSMSAVGQTGPLRGIRTYATMIGSLSGLDSMVGYPGGRALGSQSSYADPNASLHASVGILAALWQREITGEGAYIDLSQWEAAVSVLGEQVVDCELSTHLPGPRGTWHATKVPHGNYPAAGDDRWIAISVANEPQWLGLQRALGHADWMSLPEFATSAARSMRREELDQRLANETRRFDATDLAAALLAERVPAAPVLDAAGVARHAHFQERQLFASIEHPVLGRLPVYRLPWHVDGAPVPITRRAPLLGEHTDYALQSVLGYSSARIEALGAAGVLQ